MWEKKREEGKKREKNSVAKNHLKSLMYFILFVLSKQDLFLEIEVDLEYGCMDTQYHICFIIECYLS